MSSSDEFKKPYQTDTNQTKNGFLTLMSRLVIDDKLPIRFIYKTVPEHLNDTGWRLFTGYEEESFFDNEIVNMVPIPLEKLAALDPSLEPLLAYNAGTVWERHPESDGWERVYDYKIPSAQTDVSITNDLSRFEPPTEKPH